MQFYMERLKMMEDFWAYLLDLTIYIKKKSHAESISFGFPLAANMSFPYLVCNFHHFVSTPPIFVKPVTSPLLNVAP